MNSSRSLFLIGAAFLLASPFSLSAQEAYYEILESNGSQKVFPFLVTQLPGDSVEIAYPQNNGIDRRYRMLRDLPPSVDKLADTLGVRQDVAGFVASSLLRMNSAFVRHDTLTPSVNYEIDLRTKDGSTLKYVLNYTRLTDSTVAISFDNQKQKLPLSALQKGDLRAVQSMMDSLLIGRTIANDAMTQVTKSGLISPLLNKIVAALEGESSREQEPLGTIELTNASVPVYTENRFIWSSPIVDFIWKPFYEIFYLPDSLETRTQQASFQADTAKIAINEGSIEDMVVEGWYSENGTHRHISFRNLLPIPIGTSSEIDALNSWGKFLLFSDEMPANPHPNTVRAGELIVRLSDLIKYRRDVLIGGNYIPENKSIILRSGSTGGTLELKKKSFADDFDIRIYTDISGLQRNNPNGLIQTEGRYNIILNSSTIEDVGFFGFLLLGGMVVPFVDGTLEKNPWAHYGIPTASASLLFLFSGRTIPFGKISPFFVFSRIENRGSMSLSASRMPGDDKYTATTPKTFDLLKYSNLMFGTDLDLAKAIFVNLNLSTKLHVEGGFYRTPIDSIYDGGTNHQILQSLDLLSSFVTTEVVFQPIYSDRIEYDFRYGAIYSKLIDRSPEGMFEPIGQITSGIFISKIQLNFNIYANPKDRGSWLFFRSTVYLNGLDSNLSLQVGYSTSISKLVGGS
ncbi:MAG TPA: hypothetical protein VMG34_14635 [Bacteroidota bacterium]|nr:hypothetical protein [Bacteroidota bacterium]